jgi:hypothetical protein
MLTAQNQVKNSSFENNLIGYNEFYSWINSNSFAFNYIDSLTTHWNSLYSNSYSFNKNFLERDVFKNILTNNNNSNFFKLCNDKTPVHRSSFALLMPGYRSIDTAKYTPKYWVENTGNPNDSDIYWGYNPVIFSQLYAPLIRDTTYVISYRLLSGKGIGKNKSSYNFINNFGIHFSTNNLGDLSIRPHDRPTFKMNSINLMLQDTVLDTTLNWRYVRREFKADSNYNFIYFGQFLDKRKNKILISKTFFQDYGFYNGGEFTVLFAFFLDHIRLLPKWQYLEVTQDKNACEGDSFSLNVLSGSGPHKWILSSQPSNILSTSSSLKIKADTTSIFQVMSPYDTASIMVYVTKPIYDSISITSCSSYLWRGKLRSATGVYKDTIINTGGCKTYYTLKFKRTINNKVSKLDSTELRADQDSVSYQWYSCNPWTKLDGETKRTIKGSKNNTYAVVLNNGKGCIDTSECISISGSNIVSEEKLDWRVFPNPFQETFNIDLDKSYKEVEIKLYNIYGKLIIHETVKNTRDYYIQNSNLPVGFYYLQVKTENTTKFFNLKKD